LEKIFKCDSAAAPLMDEIVGIAVEEAVEDLVLDVCSIEMEYEPPQGDPG
jgi:hypothetical protein